MSMMSVFGIFLFFFMIVGAIVFAVVITSVRPKNSQQDKRDDIPTYYKTNKKTEAKEKNNVLPWVTVGVLTMVLVIGSIVVVNKFDENKSYLQSLEYNISKLNSDFWQVSSNLNSVRSQLVEMEEGERYVDYGDYEVLSVTEEGQANVEVSLYMNRLPIGEDVMLVVEREDGPIEEILMSSTTMTFQAEVTLDLDGSYKLYAMVETEAEYIKEDVLRIDMDRLVRNRMGIDIQEDFNQDGQIILFHVYNNYNLHEDMAFESVSFELYYDDVLSTSYVYTAPSDINGTRETYYHEIEIAHEEERQVTIRVVAVDAFGKSYILFHEGWWN